MEQVSYEQKPRHQNQTLSASFLGPDNVKYGMNIIDNSVDRTDGDMTSNGMFVNADRSQYVYI